MEADFNHSNKEIFGKRTLDNVRKHGLVPEEMYSEGGKVPGDGTLAKVIFNNVVRQTRLSAGVESVDAANCYNSVAHTIASLTCQAFGVPAEVVYLMITTIEDMKYYLRRTYGDSKNFRGHKIAVKFQGLCQGNGAAPAGWAVISIVIIGAHKKKGHGGHFVCPISCRTGHLSTILFVDDNDLVHVDMRKDQSVDEATHDLQRSIGSRGQLLLASGGSLKPESSFST